LAALLWSLGRAQANDSRLPIFKGKYMEYPEFKKDRRAYQRTYNAQIRDKLVRRNLKDKCMSAGVKAIVGDVENLDAVWDTLYMCYECPERST
jgi:hypothetical protein